MNATAAPEATRQMLEALWHRNLPIVQGRVEELCRAASAAVAGTLSAETRAAAEGTAHKLAGSLGMFGYQHGTEIARTLEQMLEGTAAVDAQSFRELAHSLRAELNL